MCQRIIQLFFKRSIRVFFYLSMNNILKEKIYNYCYQIKTGKPVASVVIQDRYINEAKQIINKNGLKYFIEFLSDDWFTLWIFKRDIMLEIIKALPDKPISIFDHWILVKAFGYSDEAIEEFLTSSKTGSVTLGTGR